MRSLAYQTYASCPTAFVNAPIEAVWALLLEPMQWGNVFDVRVLRVDPEGPASVGQTITAESGPRLLHLRVELRFVEIDPMQHRIRLNVRLPFGITVAEDLRCASVSPKECQVTYGCHFSLPDGVRGTILRTILRRELEEGPRDSLSRLKRAAER